MPSFLGYLGLGGSTPTPTNNDLSAVRALPASWYTSQEMYQLERRAIFSKRWLLTTHKLRFKEPGDYLRYDIADFQFVLCKDNQGNISAFHNVCRHRAFPVVTEAKGKAKIFACLYHGWSYGLNGKLAKAPGYQDLPNFDKTKNGLIPIHVHIDRNGFIWVNLDGKAQPEVAWSDDFEGIDMLPRYDGVSWDDYEFDHSWEINGNYNWKIAADNYNECYHCKTAHPDIPAIADLNSYSVDTAAGSIQHNAGTTTEQAAAGLSVAPTYLFPNSSVTASPHFFYTQRFVPMGPTNTLILYEVYRKKSSSDEDFQRIDSIYKRIMTEDKYLCNLTQKNLNSGVFINGELHPTMEKGPLYFQQAVREIVQAHHKREQAAKQEIWPARQQLPSTAMVSDTDVEFCSGLACQTTTQEDLAW